MCSPRVGHEGDKANSSNLVASNTEPSSQHPTSCSSYLCRQLWADKSVFIKTSRTCYLNELCPSPWWQLAQLWLVERHLLPLLSLWEFLSVWTIRISCPGIPQSVIIWLPLPFLPLQHPSERNANMCWSQQQEWEGAQVAQNLGFWAGGEGLHWIVLNFKESFRNPAFIYSLFPSKVRMERQCQLILREPVCCEI